MKKLLFVVIFALLSGLVFAEFQIDTDIGYFFNTDNYDSAKRSFNGLNLNIIPRYFFTENFGLFLGIDCKAWFSADNNDYIKQFESAGMSVTIDDTLGYKLDFDFGLALALPINEKFGIQSDLGLSTTILIIESITGDVTAMGYTMSFGIFPDKVSSLGLFANVFGRYLLSEQGGRHFITFGLKMDYKFTREESGEVIVAGVSEKYSGTESNFTGFSIAPFIGYMGSF
jgi:hypothetical protein